MLTIESESKLLVCWCQGGCCGHAGPQLRLPLQPLACAGVIGWRGCPSPPISSLTQGVDLQTPSCPALDLLRPAPLHRLASAAQGPPVVLTLRHPGGWYLRSGQPNAWNCHYWPTGAGRRPALGVLISATDPVSVIATFKEPACIGGLAGTVEAESLLNGQHRLVCSSGDLPPTRARCHTAGAPFSSWRSRIVGGVACRAPKWQHGPGPGRPYRGSPGGDHLHHHC